MKKIALFLLCTVVVSALILSGCRERGGDIAQPKPMPHEIVGSQSGIPVQSEVVDSRNEIPSDASGSGNNKRNNLESAEHFDDTLSMLQELENSLDALDTIQTKHLLNP